MTTSTTTAASSSTAAAAYILYVDHQGHVAPIGRCYHATASRRLSSSVERHPPSTQSEMDSAFCPQCLSFHDAASASQLGFCPKTTCQRCPQCDSIASVALEDNKCFYACGYCDWNSLTIGLHSPCTEESQVKAATEALGKDLMERRSMRQQEEQYQSTLKTLEAVAVEELRRRKQPNLIMKDPDYTQVWNMEALTKSLETKIEKKTPAFKGLGQPVEEKPVVPINTASVTSLLQSPDRLPLPIALVPRKSLRCRAELAEGRPGILIKPKLNPLEGDTSLRSGHGQWYKKDSSAIHVVPRVSVQRTDGSFVLLRLHNPTLGVVKLSLGPSAYPGQVDFDDPTQQGRTTELINILVDSLRGTRMRTTTLDTSFQLAESSIISLEAVQDTFLELGSQGDKLPDEVQSWSGDTNNTNKVGWIAQKRDKAWFAFDAGDSECISLAMKIVVAKGSWESSLIQQNGDNDSVTFDMVLIRPKKQ